MQVERPRRFLPTRFRFDPQPAHVAYAAGGAAVGIGGARGARRWRRALSPAGRGDNVRHIAQFTATETREA